MNPVSTLGFIVWKALDLRRVVRTREAALIVGVAGLMMSSAASADTDHGRIR